MKKTLVKEFRFSPKRYGKNIFVFLIAAFALFYFTGFTSDLSAWILPLAFVGSLFFVSGIYAWTVRDKVSLSVYDCGFGIGSKFIPWSEVENVSLRRVDIDTISYLLSVTLNNQQKIEHDINHFSEPSNDVFQLVNQTFRQFKGEVQQAS